MVGAANLNIAPAGALAIGIGSGCLSTLGYVYSQPFLEKTIGLRDTCGVINLHGGPGIMGGVAAGEAMCDKIISDCQGSEYSHSSRPNTCPSPNRKGLSSENSYPQ